LNQAIPFTLAVAASLITAAPMARAETFTCVYTEPFVTTSYDEKAQTLTYDDAGAPEKNRVLKNVSIIVLSPNVFALRNDQKTILQRMDHNNRGSDGMSDKTFPYDATLFGYVANFDLRGGCTSKP